MEFKRQIILIFISSILLCQLSIYNNSIALYNSDSTSASTIDHWSRSASENDTSTDYKPEIIGSGMIIYYYPMNGSPSRAVSDIDHDGHAELIVGSEEDGMMMLSDEGEVIWEDPTLKPTGDIFTGNFYCNKYENICFFSWGACLNMLDPDGSLLWSSDTMEGTLMCYKVGDIDGDGLDELVTYSRPYPSGRVTAWDGNGSILWTFDTEKFPGGSEAIDIADLDGDGINDILIGTWVNENDTVLAISSSGELLWGAFIKNEGILLGNFSEEIYTIKAVDIDSDSKLEIMVGGSYLTLLDKTGSIIWNEKVSLIHSLCMGDFNGDGSMEMAGTSNEEVHIFNRNGIFKSFSSERVSNRVYSADLFGTGSHEIIVTTMSSHGPSGWYRPPYSMVAYNYSGGPIWQLTNSSTSGVFSDLDDDGSMETIVSSGGNYSGLLIIKTTTENQLPDLAIDPSGITFSDQSPAHGDMLEIKVNVTNIGFIGANAVVRFMCDNETDEISTTPMIYNGSTKQVTFDWLTREGLHNLKIILDPAEIIQETNETNNMVLLELNVTPANDDSLPDDDNTDDITEDDTGEDSDEDGFSDKLELETGTDPDDPLSYPSDFDDDGDPDYTDPDDDNDMYSDSDELACDSNPLDQSSTPSDLDGDLTPDKLDDDIDDDGYPNDDDAFPYNGNKWVKDTEPSDDTGYLVILFVLIMFIILILIVVAVLNSRQHERI